MTDFLGKKHESPFIIEWRYFKTTYRLDPATFKITVIFLWVPHVLLTGAPAELCD